MTREEEQKEEYCTVLLLLMMMNMSSDIGFLSYSMSPGADSHITLCVWKLFDLFSHLFCKNNAK